MMLKKEVCMLKRIIMLVLAIVTIILESLPYSVAMRWISGNVTYEAYFSEIAFGYALFTPLITAIITCMILILCVVSCFVNKKGLQIAISVFCIIATALSPVHFFMSGVTVLGIVITICLLTLSIISFLKVNDKKQ